MPKFCCPSCVGDRGLTANIFPTLELIEGDCDYCGTTSDSLVRPESLRDYFELVSGAYEPDPEADKNLAQILISDWKIFDHPNLNEPAATLLLADILDDGDLVRRGHRPFSDSDFTPVADWEVLKDELRYKNRYFLDEKLKDERLAELLSYLISDPLQAKWYRARLIGGDTLYLPNEMGAPPKGVASHGRANPSGIPYLYLGSTPETCVSEIRPHTGEHACVGEFDLDGLKGIVDLRNPRKLASPFLLEATSEIVQLRADLPFLEKLGAELTRPILPRSAAIDYVPSQYLCEFIKKQGFSGVLYSSSVSDGINLALFDPDIGEAKAVNRFEVSKVSVTVSKLV